MTSYTFAPAATASIIIPAGFPPGGTLALPSVDSGNLDSRVTNNSAIAVRVAFGTAGSIATGPGSGALMIPAGGVVLVPALAGAATVMCANVAAACPVSLFFERGTISTATPYDAKSLAVAA